MDRPSSRAARQESLREHNLALVAREVLSAARPLSRAEVAARTGLNRATVSRLVAELVAGRLVTEDTPVVSGAGRPATPLRPAPRSEEHTSELQSRGHLVCRLLLENKNK